MDRGGAIELIKDWALALGITAAVVVGWQWLQPDPVRSGPAPTLAVVDLDGAPWTLDAVDEDIVVVNFWATWCGPCREEIPELSAYARSADGVALIGVSTDTALSGPQLRAASRRLGIDYPVVHDRDQSAAGAWGVTGYPTTFVLDAHRHVVATRFGTVDRRGLAAMVDEARAHAH